MPFLAFCAVIFHSKCLKRIFGVFDCISALLFLDLQSVSLRKSALKCTQIHSKLHLPALRNTLYEKGQNRHDEILRRYGAPSPH